MDTSKPLCERCGAPAIVHITSENSAGSGVRHLCLNCADSEDAAVRRTNRGLDHAAILIVTGLMALIISGFADVLKWGNGGAFGYKQIIAVFLAGGGLLIGAAARIPTLYLLGLVTGGLTLIADYARFGNSPGYGVEQCAGVIAGAILLGAGIFVARRG
jgi:hypothetical protein